MFRIRVSSLPTLTVSNPNPAFTSGQTLNICAGSTASFHPVTARGDSLLAQMLSLAFYGDFVSLYLAALNQVDPENIDGINVLKNELAKIGG